MVHIVVEETGKEIWKGDVIGPDEREAKEQWLASRGLEIKRKEYVDGKPFWYVGNKNEA